MGKSRESILKIGSLFNKALYEYAHIMANSAIKNIPKRIMSSYPLQLLGHNYPQHERIRRRNIVRIY